MKRSIKRLLSLVLSLCLILSHVPAAWAAGAGEGQFAIAVLTADGQVISPTYIPYDQGDTIADALLDSGYSFTGLENGWVTAIEGVVDSFALFYDENGYDLTASADSITALCFTTKADRYSPEYLHLICVMADYSSRTDGIAEYAAAREAYDLASAELYNADAAKAAECAAALEEAMAAYDGYLYGDPVKLTIDAGGPVYVTLTGQFGNTYYAENVTGLEVAPGEYAFDLSDGGTNHIRGSITVAADTTLTAQLPTGSWIAGLDLSIAPGTDWEAVAKTADGVYCVPDYAGRNLYPYLVPGEGVDTSLVTVHLNDGARRVWKSYETALTGVLTPNSMEGTVFTLEARKAWNDYTQYQTMDVEIVRVPSLAELTVTGDGTLLPLTLDPAVTEYTVSTTSDTVDIRAAALCGGTSIEINGTAGETVNVPLTGDVTKIPVTVSHENGQRRTYTVSVCKEESVDVTIRTLDSSVSVAVFNEAGSEIAAVHGVFPLVPGENYTYVATKNGFYHTTAAFVAEAGLTITAPTPVTEDWLSSLEVRSAKKADPYESDREFAPEVHAYTYQVGSNETAFALLSELSEAGADCTRTALYYDFRTWDPSFYKLHEVEVTTSYKAVTSFLGASGIGNEMTLRLSRTDGEVTYYQDYLLTAQRKLQLNDLSLAANGQALILGQETGTDTGYSKFILDYTAELGESLTEAELSLTLFSTDTGNDNAFLVTAACGGWSEELDYTALAVDAVQTLRVPLDPALAEQTLTVTLARDGAASQTYRVTLKKLSAAATAITTDPAEAVVYLTEDATGLRVLPGEDGVYFLNTGKTYHYTVTLYGYLTAAGSFIAGEENAALHIPLSKAPENTLTDILLDTDYPSFRGNDANNAVTDVPTPIEAEATVLAWANKIGEALTGGGVGSPIIVGGYIYTYANSTICKVDKDTGEIVLSRQMDHASSFSITPPAYGEGMLFVGLSDGSVQAFSAGTLESLWVYRDALKGQPNSPIVYKDGYIYTGFWNSEVKEANFVCISVTDEDPTASDEAKQASWTYTHAGFYWAGAYVADNFLLVTSDDGAAGYTTGHGTLLSLNPKDGTVIDSLTMPGVGDLRSSVCYDSATKAYYFTSKGGDFYQIQVADDGAIQDDTLKQLHLSNGSESDSTPPMSTSTPVVYKGRAYIGVCGTSQFGAYSGHNLTVIDLTNWKVAYTVPTQGYPQTSGLLTTAYEEDSEYVYVYFLDNYTPGKLRVIRDRAGQNTFDTAYSTTETYTSGGQEYTVSTGYVLFTPSGNQAQYAICSPIADENGSLYFKNDSGYLMCLSSAITALTVEQSPSRTVYEAGQTFDPAGLKVTAQYANGVTRDVTRFITCSDEPLTADDTEFTLVYDLGQHQQMYQDKSGKTGVLYHVPTATIDLTITTDHTWDEGIITREPTCVHDGERTFTCATCGQTRTEPIPATGEHTWDSGVITQEPTEDTPGEILYTCQICGQAHTESLPPHAHAYTVTETVEPTCTADGFTRHTCPECGYGYTDTPVPALGHDWDGAICTRCGEVRENPFTDVPEGSFYYEPVIWAVRNGITNGTTPTTFGPNDQCMRAQVVTFLWRAAGSPEPASADNPFVDVKETDFYYEAVLWAVENGITNGLDSTHFGPYSHCNRAQVVTFLHRALGSPAPSSMDNPFTDVQEGQFYYVPVLWAVENGITNGLSSTSFGPSAICNRAQIVTFLYRAYL